MPIHLYYPNKDYGDRAPALVVTVKVLSWMFADRSGGRHVRGSCGELPAEQIENQACSSHLHRARDSRHSRHRHLH